MTTGPNTRRALAAAGARGAAWGTTIHLPAPPERSPRGIEVLAHELAHVSDRPLGPRLFLDDIVDTGERRARDIGRRAGSLVGAASSRAAPLVGAGRAAATRAAEAIPAGVSSFPVGGMGAAAAAVRERLAAPAEAMESAVGPVPGEAANVMEAASGLGAEGRRMLGEASGAAERGVAEASAVAGGVAGGAREGGAALGALVGSATTATDSYSQVGELLEALEDRVLAELERRGGRFAGMF